MRRVLKRLAPALCLGLSACGMLPGLSSGNGSADPSAAAPAPTTPSSTVTSTVNAAAAVATAAGTPTPDNVVNAANAVAGAVTAATASTPVSGSQTVTFDSTKKLEYADVYVDMGDPTGMQALVPYLLKPKDWMLVGCEMTSATSKHYRFMKVASNTGQELPDVNIFKGR